MTEMRIPVVVVDIPPGAAERFWSKVRVGEPDECWPWVGPVNRDGYGRFRVTKTIETGAHRMAYRLATGKTIPVELTVDHLCNSPSCCNPHHLDAVTMRVNNLRSQGLAAQNARKTHCIHGHEFTPENTRLSTRKGHPNRECRKCNRIRETARRAAARAKRGAAA